MMGKYLDYDSLLTKILTNNMNIFYLKMNHRT